MKKIISFIKDSIITGVVVVVPIAVIAVILSSTLKKLFTLTSPITENITFGGAVFKTAVVILILAVILCVFFFINGLILKTYLGQTFTSWLEKKILSSIPFFETIKGITSHFVGANKEVYNIVEVNLDSKNNKILGLLTDKLEDGRCVVYCPFAPVINVGQVYIVSEENVTRLEMSLKDFTDIITKVGFQSNKVFRKIK